jgi:SPP1 gp7 family putative phage head morphogenesis protein
MGRTRDRRREKALEEALAAALRRGIEEGERRAFERTLRAAASEALGLEVRDTLDFVEQAGVRGALPLIAEAAAQTWPARYRERLSPVLSALMEAATEDRAPVLGSFTLRNPRMAEWFSGYTSELAGTLSQTSADNAVRVIREAMDEGLSVLNTAARLGERLPELNRSRSELIARTELHRASVGASDIQARASGVVRSRIWRATNDSRTRPEHAAMHGEEVGLDEPFSNGLDYPSEPNCRCYVEYTVDLEAIRGGAA